MSEFDLDTFSENMLKKLNRRLDWDEYHMACAVLVGSRSNCERLHVGCILVKNQRLVSAGYNGFLPSAPHTSCVRDGHEQSTVHAEQNAIADAASRGAMVKDATAYVTHRPCNQLCENSSSCRDPRNNLSLRIRVRGRFS